eukprot:Plantae.Rhodophyta-Purpureofilum_apyrenoidigerum.ctg41546.p1 GENE.Plantae.Rhodophyta-Purpureofilum_apyrenoidigerum.ctg41546~~Plantae.Rhodophyta-Purpureofilum_apyrenoidigerum.ctg41546.p1  ORF type:complete len:163 (-),score=33.44 Plantae.Rhodophyta-Purpureofilum_apyrenoidigerum.ctg41546:362-829(-)
MGLLARVHMTLGELSDALETIRRILPAALHGVAAKEKGTLHLVHAACMYEDSDHFSFEEVIAEATLAEESFRLSLQMTGMYEASVLQAKIANRYGQVKLRNEASKRARQSAELLERAKDEPPFAIISKLNGLFRTTSAAPHDAQLYKVAPFAEAP